MRLTPLKEDDPFNNITSEANNYNKDSNSLLTRPRDSSITRQLYKKAIRDAIASIKEATR